MKKVKEVELIEKWRDGWSTPDVYCVIDRRRKRTPDNLILLRGHTDGEFPFVKYVPVKED